MKVRARHILAVLIATFAVARPATVAAVDISAAGSEFQVNTYTRGYQFNAAVAADALGNFVVVWQAESQDGDDFGVFGQRFSSGGTRLGREFQVNSYTLDAQDHPAVGSDAVGNFVVVWLSGGQDGDGSGVFGQLFAEGGARLGSEFQVNTHTIAAQARQQVARDEAGNFLVVWGSTGAQDGEDAGVFGQLFASDGTPRGSEFQINTFTPDNQNYPAVATDRTGNFVVVWQGQSEDGQSYGIFGQRFASNGAQIGSEFQINTYFTGTQTAPAVASDELGNFVVAWQSPNQDDSDQGVFAQRFANDGNRIGTEFQVNTYTLDAQGNPAVFAEKSGFVVAWDSSGQDGSDTGIFGQHFTSNGARIGGEFQINTYTFAEQTDSAIAGAAGKFVVVWEGDEEDSPELGVFGQRFALPGGVSPAPALSHPLLLLMGVLLAAFGWWSVRRRRPAS